MIKWSANGSNGQRRKRIIATLSDLKICEACINEYDTFQNYLEILEDGQDDGKFPAQIQNKIIVGIEKLNWTDFNFSM